MSRMIITYDLSNPGRDYDTLIARIKSYGAWAHITESSWAIVTNQTPVGVRDNLKAAIDDNDKLLVGILGTAAWIGLPSNVSDWLKKNS